MKINFKSITTLAIVLFLFVFSGHAQDNNFHKGTILLNKKKKVEAYIQIDFTRPQNFQKEITYVEPKGYAKYQKGTKLKKVKEVFKPKDILGFDLEDGRKWRTKKYMDLSKEGMGIIQKKLFLQQIVGGKVDMFKLYQDTGSKGSVGISKISYDVEAAVRESKKQNNPQILIDHIQSNFQLLAQKEYKTPKNVMAMNMFNLIGDNADIKEKYMNNHYGVKEFITRDGGGFMAHENNEKAFLKMISDYNSASKAAR